MTAHAFGEQMLPPWKRAVLKVGSSLLAADNGGLSERFAAGLAQFVAQARAQGREVVIVSSGAVAGGRGVLHAADTTRDFTGARTLSLRHAAHQIHDAALGDDLERVGMKVPGIDKRRSV